MWTGHESFEQNTNRKPSPTWHEYVDVIYYINLDHRKDRLQEFLEEMKTHGDVPESKLVRIPGVYKPGQGDLGCSLSHIKAIQHFTDSSASNCIVFEDDFQFIQDINSLNYTMSDFVSANIPYDICMLSSNTIESTETEWSFLRRVQSTQTASGYMVSKAFAPTILTNYQEGARLLEESYSEGKGDHIQGRFCVDQYWKRLQPGNKWYVFEPKWGKQRDSVSDIQGGFVKMTV